MIDKAVATEYNNKLISEGVSGVWTKPVLGVSVANDVDHGDYLKVDVDRRAINYHGPAESQPGSEGYTSPTTNLAYRVITFRLTTIVADSGAV